MLFLNLVRSSPMNLPSKFPLSMSLIEFNILKRPCGVNRPVLLGSSKDITILNFFHRVANTRYRYNFIHMLQYQEETLYSHVDNSNAFIEFYSHIFAAPHHSLVHANWKILYPNCEWSSRDIEHPFNEDEIKAAIFGLGAEKAPGPDGFPILFFQIF